MIYFNFRRGYENVLSAGFYGQGGVLWIKNKVEATKWRGMPSTDNRIYRVGI
jgi:hypothetical protein